MDVSILWDAAAKPVPDISGFQVVKAIRNVAEMLGLVKAFKFYTDVGDYDAPSPSFRSQVQCSGVTLVDTAANGRAGSATKMILVDAFVHALDNPPSNHAIFIISVDRDVCYGVSLLKARGFQVFILCPSNSHPSLMEFRFDGAFDASVLHDQAATWSRDAPTRPQGRRASFRVPSGNPHLSNGKGSSEPIVNFPALRDFQEGFTTIDSSPRTASGGDMGRPKVPSRSKADSPATSQSSSLSSANQIYRTPKARVDADDEDGFIAITPPKAKESGATKDNLGDTPNTGFSSLSFKSTSSSSGFFMVPPYLSSSLTSPPPSNFWDTSANRKTLKVPEANASPLPNLQQPIAVEKVTSSTSTATLKAGPSRSSHPAVPPPVPVESPREPPAQVSDAQAPERVKTPSIFPPPQKAPLRTAPSFFPPPPLSPDRTNISSLPGSQLPASLWSPDISKGQASITSGLFTFVAPKPVAGPPSITAHPPTSSLPANAPKRMTTNAQIGGTILPTLATPSADAKATVIIPPPPSTSSTAAAKAIGASVIVPSQFATLVTVMKELGAQTNRPVARSFLAAALLKHQPDIYTQAGFSGSHRFKKYMESAIEAGIIDDITSEIVDLNPAYK